MSICLSICLSVPILKLLNALVPSMSGAIVSVISRDGGATWSPVRAIPSSTFPCPQNTSLLSPFSACSLHLSLSVNSVFSSIPPPLNVLDAPHIIMANGFYPSLVAEQDLYLAMDVPQPSFVSFASSDRGATWVQVFVVILISFICYSISIALPVIELLFLFFFSLFLRPSIEIVIYYFAW